MNCRRDCSMRSVIVALNYVLLVLSLALFAALAVVFFQTIFRWEYHPMITREGVSVMQEFWLEYKYIIQAFGGCLTLFIVSYNLQKYIDMETVKALGNLRDKLNGEEKVKLHTYLMHKDDRKPILQDADKRIENGGKIRYGNAVLFDYIGTIELGAIMVKRRVISIDEYYNQFGYRIENLMANEDIRSHIKDNMSYYGELRRILKLLVRYGKLPKDCEI